MEKNTTSKVSVKGIQIPFVECTHNNEVEVCVDMRWKKISDAVVRRLPLYLRVLDDLARNKDAKLISSHELGDRAGVGPALVRKDLAWFGEFGKQGVGYEIEYLRLELRKILNLEGVINVALVGVGSLGAALTRFHIRKFDEDDSFNLKICALFDEDPEKHGQVHDGVTVHSSADMAEVVRAQNIEMAIITVPAGDAQDVAQRLVDAGIRAILNFAPTKITVPDGVQLATADLSLELQRLAYYLQDE